MFQVSDILQMGVAGLSVYLMYKLSGNHIDHNTRAINSLRDVLEQLKEAISDAKRS